jgi:hypothetical protein
VRITRRRERQVVPILRAVPFGACRAPSQKAWLDALDACPRLGELRADRRATVTKIARQIAYSAAWDTMTSRPTWARLMDTAQVSRRTVARTLELLREVGLVGIVATGRSAGFQPNAADATAEAAVYVLCVPSPLAPVDELGTPTPVGLSVEEPLRARETANSSSVPLRGPHLLPAGAGAALVGPADRSVRPAGLLDRRMRLERRMSQARQLQARVPVLRRLTDRAVAAVVRDFQLAEWTTADLAHAIDWRPDGSRWAHAGATGVALPAKWLEYRLRPWRDESGQVLPSRSAAALAAAQAHLADQLAKRADDQADAAGRPWVEYSPGFAAFKAARAALPTPR